MPTSTLTLDEALISLLARAGIATEQQLNSVREQSQGDQSAFEHLLLHENILTEVQLAELKAQAYGWRFVDLDREPVIPEFLNRLPRRFAESQQVIPYKGRNETLHLALVDLSNEPLVRLLNKKFGSGVPLALATGSAVAAVLGHDDMRHEDRYAKVITHAQSNGKDMQGDDQSIVELVDMLLLQAVRQGASDIHIEPAQNDVAVRLRIDGILHRIVQYPKALHPRVALRIKVLGNLATDEHAAPQDGKLLYKHPEGKHVDVRLSVLPTTKGEKIVLRLLISSDQAFPLESLGLQQKEQALLQDEMKRSWGMILVTGPTGSGKTTSLYAVMRLLNNEEVNISTIEDPVEYDLPGANQIQVNEKVDLTFATGLRSIVRQDPNIILVGEIRDRETAGIAVNSAMTGHLVLSTLHTNDAPTAIPRLIDMGIEPFLITSTVNVVIAQRLVRAICVRCRESVEMEAERLAKSLPPDVAAKLPLDDKKTIRLYHGKGCPVCNNTGFHGRTGIFEMLRMDDAIRALVLQSASADAIRTEAKKRGMTSMMDDGIAKAIQGITTLEEVLRVIRS